MKKEITSDESALEDWESKKIIECIEEIKSGDWGFENEDSNLVKCRVLRGTDIPNIMKMNFNNVPIRYIERKKYEESKPEVNDVLIEISGGSKDQPTGRILIITKEILEKSDERLFFSNFIKLLKIKKFLNPIYFYYFWNYLYSKGKTVLYENRTTNIRNFNYELFLREEEISYPKLLEEQEAIAQILSTFDEAIQKTDEIVAKTERLKKGLMKELLTGRIRVEEKDGKIVFRKETEFKDTGIGKIPKDWEVVKIKDIFFVETGTTPSTRKKEYWENGTINWFTPTDLSKLEGKITIKNSERKITERALKENNLTLLPKNSIIVSTRAPVGYVAILEEPGAFNQGCKGLIPKDNNKISSHFYSYYLLHIKHILQNLSGGSTFKELSKDRLENLLVPYLKLEEQQRIAEILLTIDKKLELEKNRKEKIERIKKGLMDLLLTGKIRIKVKDDVIK
jgi:type I restriction enzyme S subunit